MKFTVYITQKNYRSVEMEADSEQDLVDRLDYDEKVELVWGNGEESGPTEYDYYLEI